MTSFIDQYVSLKEREDKMREWRSESKVYPLEVSMNDSAFMNVDQTPSGVRQLDEPFNHKRT